MSALNEAWALLKDADRRSAFDAEFAKARAATGERQGGADAAGRFDTTRPFWTGAAGPPPGRPYGSVLDFGIFAGWSLGEILRRDRGYLAWLRDKPEGRPYAAEITRLLDPTAEETPARGRRYR
jgi:hypothetical protein